MKTITLIPGSFEWIKSRSASKAAAMMGDDPKTSRTDLIRMMATGLGKEFTEWQQKNLIDKGNATEGGTRDIAEDVIGDGLSPACASTDDGYLTAAPDGVTFDGRIGFEAKTWNEKLAAAVRAQDLPKSHHWQLDQQILVFGLEYVLFCVSDGTRENFVSMEYRSTPERAAKLLAGWKQLDEDVAAYTHVEAAPVAVAAPIKDLPAIVVHVSGALTVETNFAVWGEELKNFIDRIPERVPEKLSTDQEFADCKAAIAAFKKAEAQLDAEENRVLSAVPDVDEMKRVKKLLRDMSSTTRLILEKRATSRDQEVKIEIMQEGKDALAAHIAGLNKRLAKVQMPPIAADFAAAIKGKKLYSAMRASVADLVAAKKIETSEIADRITINLQALHDGARLPNADYSFLFSDYAQLILKAPDDLALVIKSRIQDHVVAEEKRIAAEREKIRAEEEARAAAKVKADQDAAEAQRKAAEEAAAKIERDRLRATQATPAPVLSEKSVADANAKAFVDSISTTETAAPAAPGASSPRLDETPKAAAHTGITGSARLLDRLDDLARQMTEAELSELCIHAAHILENRRAAA